MVKFTFTNCCRVLAKSRVLANSGHLTVVTLLVDHAADANVKTDVSFDAW